MRATTESHKSAKVLLDGVEVSYCFAADDVEGWVDCFRLNENGLTYMECFDTETRKWVAPAGALYQTYDKDGKPRYICDQAASHRRFGKVEIVMPEAKS